MSLSRLLIKDFRNIEHADLALSPGFNFLVGANGSGKTSVLEAIYTLGHGRAFRSLQIGRVIRHEQDAFVLHGRLQGEERETAIGLTKDKQGDSKVRIDGTDGHKVAELAHLMPMQLITPEGFTLLNGGPIQAGAVLLGGRDVRSIPTAELMEQISFVFQEVRLFKKSIRDNIRAARPDATEEEILHAAQLAQCSDILEKTPGGLDAVIGAKGVYLSGGEMQRIALARAILKDAPIVVLDEASSFADPENEAKIQKAFEALMKGKTVLMIAHRLSTVRNMDRILVVRDGEIAEEGKHDELLEKGGVYAAMWEEYQKAAQWKVGGAA